MVIFFKQIYLFFSFLTHHKYTVQILKRFKDAEIDILVRTNITAVCCFSILPLINFKIFITQDALPTPFGLVRFGVAPDHPDTKNVINQFTTLAKDPRINFFGNVRLGSTSLSLSELRSFYNAVVLAYGAESDRRLGIPGSNLSGIFPAREFVQWYNGHPAAASLPLPNLQNVSSVAICGLGNVALDIARVLLQPVQRLAATDAAMHAVDALRHSAVKEVHLLGRRGPAQAAFTPKELRELLGMEGIRVEVHPEGCLELTSACRAEIKSNRIKKRVMEVLMKAAAVAREMTRFNSEDRVLHLHFLRNPVQYLDKLSTRGSSSDSFSDSESFLGRKTDDDQGSVAGVRVEVTELQSSDAVGDVQRAIGTSVFEDVPAQLVLESIGYKSCAVDGAPFDDRIGIIPNQLGQVLKVEKNNNNNSGGKENIDNVEVENGLFVCGWLKRGPSGIIGTNLVDAEQTVDTMVRSKESFPAVDALPGGRQGLAALLASRGVEVVDFAGWEKIDAEEVRRGEAVGKPRVKIVDVEEMLAVVAGK